MEAGKEDGGQAFPVPGLNGLPNGSWIEPTVGMTLRDYFAGQAMRRHGTDRPSSLYQWVRWALGKIYKASGSDADNNAKRAYHFADAMIKARNQ